jgi:hypothetical protein
MRSSISEEIVAVLARAAGFDLAPDRCKLLAPQLDWLLGEAEHLASLDLSGEEPLGVFRPGLLPTTDAAQGKTEPGS